MGKIVIFTTQILIFTGENENFTEQITISNENKKSILSKRYLYTYNKSNDIIIFVTYGNISILIIKVRLSMGII